MTRRSASGNSGLAGRLVLVRGGGDLGSGVVLRLVNAGFRVVVTEIEKPLVVRRSVAFAEAVFSGEITVENVRARRVDTVEEAFHALEEGIVPVLVDPQAESISQFTPDILVDARMTKRAPELAHPAAPLVIGLGPGFTAGVNCHAVIETKRGHFMGRIYWEGSAEHNTGVPEAVERRQSERVLRAPADGEMCGRAKIGDVLAKGDLIAIVNGVPVVAPFDGLLRGLLADGIVVSAGMKIGDVDPRTDPRLVRFISDKSLAMGGAVLAAILQWFNRGEGKQ